MIYLDYSATTNVNKEVLASFSKCAEEFFANVFEAKVTSKHQQFDSLMKFLPKTFNAFEELFAIVYDHIQNNKRFTDVKIVDLQEEENIIEDFIKSEEE